MKLGFDAIWFQLCDACKTLDAVERVFILLHKGTLSKGIDTIFEGYLQELDRLAKDPNAKDEDILLSLVSFEQHLAEQTYKYFSGVEDTLDRIGYPDQAKNEVGQFCLLYTSPSPRDRQKSRMPSSA